MFIFGCIYSNYNELFASDNHWENFGYGEEYMRIVETKECIWIGSRAGLIEYNKSNGQKKVHTRANSKLPSNYITSLASDKDDAIWIGTFGGGLVRFDGVTMEIYNSENSMLPGNYVRAIDIDKDGKLWISADGGLAKFDFPLNTGTLMNTVIIFQPSTSIVAKLILLVLFGLVQILD